MKLDSFAKIYETLETTLPLSCNERSILIFNIEFGYLRLWVMKFECVSIIYSKD